MRVRAIKSGPLSPPRGVAMLIVLGTLVVVVTACATLAHVAATVSASRRSDARLRKARELSLAVEPAILRWLNIKSFGVVLPPTGHCPEVPVLRDSWIAGENRVEIRVTAYDQWGMLGSGGLGSPLRSAIPANIAAVAGDLKSIGREGEALGLDLWAGAARHHKVGLFPVPADEETPKGSSQSLGSEPMAVLEEYLGGWVATHNPGRVLNINTAPMPLLEAAFRDAGRGGIEQVRKARAEGRPAATPEGRRAGRRAEIWIPMPVGSSSVWAFRIDALVGPSRHSVWSVFSADSGQWRCVQRLVIDR